MAIRIQSGTSLDDRSQTPSERLRRFLRLLCAHVTLYRTQELAVAREHRLRLPHVRCLAEFTDQPELTVRELTRRLGLSHSRLSHILESLEDRRMISRRVNADDRRIVIVDLSPQGSKVVEALEAGLWPRYESALRALPREAVDAAITVLVRSLEAPGPERHQASGGE